MSPVDPGVAVALGSGVAVGLLGIAIAFSGARRLSTYSFSAFLIIWGSRIVTANMSRVTADAGDLAATKLWLLVGGAFLIVQYLPLVHFAESFGTRRGWLVRTTPGTAVLLAPGLMGGVAMAVDPTLYHEGFREIGGSIQSVWGPLFVVFVTLFVASFYLLVWRLVQQHREAVREIERSRARDLFLAVSLYLAFYVTETSVLFGSTILSGDPLFQDVVFVVSSLVGIPLLVWAGREFAGGHRNPKLTWAAIGIPAAFGTLSGVTIASPAFPAIRTLGLWRLMTVGVIAYAVLRYELFDIDVRATRGTAFAGAFLVTVAAGYGASRVTGAVFDSANLGALAGVAVAGGLLLGLAYRRPGFLVALESELGAQDRLDRRRLEVYEAAVVREKSRQEPLRGRTLERLRQDLDLSEAEGALLEQHVAEGRVGGRVPEPEAGTVLGDRYELEAPLGTGRSGRAWVAEDSRSGGPVVVKILDRPLSDREALYGFLRESRAARRVDHPNVVSVLDIGLHGDHPYLVLEHVAGGSLDEVLEKDGRLDPDRAREVVDDVLAGLQALHEAGVIHRDVKAENVLLDEDGTAVLADLDIAGPVDPDATIAGLGDVTRAGTPATMSPEVAAGEDATPASDVYAAGALLHLLLAGEPYVDLTGTRPGDVAARIRSADPADLPGDVPEGLRGVVRRALRTDPSERYPTAEAMRQALAEAA